MILHNRVNISRLMGEATVCTDTFPETLPNVCQTRLRDKFTANGEFSDQTISCKLVQLIQL